MLLLCADEDIEKEAFLTLTESLVGALIPKIGQRARFMAKLTELKNEVGCHPAPSQPSSRSVIKQQLNTFGLSCFICEHSFTGWDSLNIHFKVYHNLLPSSTYICKQGDCQRDFNSVRTFRRHILREHATQSDVSDSLDNADLPVDSESDAISDACMPESCDESDICMGDDIDIGSLFDDRGVCIPVATFIAKLKSHSSIPASVVDDILLDVQECFSEGLIAVLKAKTMQVLT